MNLVKGAIGIAASIGAGTVVGNAIKSTTPMVASRLSKVSVMVGSVVLTGMVGTAAEHWARQQYDEIKEAVRDLKRKPEKD